MRWSDAARRRSLEAIALVAFASVAVSAALAAHLGPGTRFITELYIAPFMSIVLLYPLRVRIPLVVLLTADAIGAARLANPSVLGFETWLAVMGGAALVAMSVGHAFYYLLRDNHLQSVALSEASADLKRMNRDLEARVAARTEELRALSGHLSEMLEEERVRIARDVHDDLGQTLTAMRLEIDLGGTKPPTEATLTKLRSLVERSLDAARRITAELRPRGLDELGLSAAIERLADDFREHTGCACELSIDSDLQPDSRRATALFRIVQESLNNVMKHAAARRVEVTIAEDEGVFRLVVADDGRGIPQTGLRKGALGLLGMRERALQLGGRVTVSRGRSSGTVVDAEIPAADEQAKPAEVAA
jgi:signal transduction histidine kinase